MVEWKPGSLALKVPKLVPPNAWCGSWLQKVWGYWEMSRSSIHPECHKECKTPRQVGMKAPLSPWCWISVHLCQVYVWGWPWDVSMISSGCISFPTVPNQLPPFQISMWLLQCKSYYYFHFPDREPRIREIRWLIGSHTVTNSGAGEIVGSRSCLKERGGHPGEGVWDDSHKISQNVEAKRQAIYCNGGEQMKQQCGKTEIHTFLFLKNFNTIHGT